jgi:hypothetical protein
MRSPDDLVRRLKIAALARVCWSGPRLAAEARVRVLREALAVAGREAAVEAGHP